MTADWLELAPEEAVAWEGRPRLSAALPNVAVGLVMVAIGVAVAAGVTSLARPVALSVGALLLVGGLGASAFGLLRVARTRYRVTDRSIGLRSGVLTRTVRTVPLARVQDSSFSQDVMGRLLGYGTVTLETAGGDSFSFDRIDDPGTVRRLVDRRGTGREQRVDGVPGDADQWRAVREEVRAVRASIERR